MREEIEIRYSETGAYFPGMLLGGFFVHLFIVIDMSGEQRRIRTYEHTRGNVKLPTWKRITAAHLNDPINYYSIVSEEWLRSNSKLVWKGVISDSCFTVLTINAVKCEERLQKRLIIDEVCNAKDPGALNV